MIVKRAVKEIKIKKKVSREQHLEENWKSQQIKKKSTRNVEDLWVATFGLRRGKEHEEVDKTKVKTGIGRSSSLHTLQGRFECRKENRGSETSIEPKEKISISISRMYYHLHLWMTQFGQRSVAVEILLRFRVVGKKCSYRSNVHCTKRFADKTVNTSKQTASYTMCTHLNRLPLQSSQVCDKNFGFFLL